MEKPLELFLSSSKDARGNVGPRAHWFQWSWLPAAWLSAPHQCPTSRQGPFLSEGKPFALVLGHGASQVEVFGTGSSWRGSREERAQGRVWERVRKVKLIWGGGNTVLPM